ncbi:hypothetical protein R3P38DRAFT_3365229 [Favolaschia claudopus]|uniref:Uncharacterized protein n=1 Tax=Favolaschia claudopus TaxID=2862362 RepID=A0AAW0AJG5_9AGAR
MVVDVRISGNKPPAFKRWDPVRKRASTRNSTKSKAAAVSVRKLDSKRPFRWTTFAWFNSSHRPLCPTSTETARHDRFISDIGSRDGMKTPQVKAQVMSGGSSSLQNGNCITQTHVTSAPDYAGGPTGARTWWKEIRSEGAREREGDAAIAALKSVVWEWYHGDHRWKVVQVTPNDKSSASIAASAAVIRQRDAEIYNGRSGRLDACRGMGSSRDRSKRGIVGAPSHRRSNRSNMSHCTERSTERRRSIVSQRLIRARGRIRDDGRESPSAGNEGHENKGELRMWEKAEGQMWLKAAQVETPEVRRWGGGFAVGDESGCDEWKEAWMSRAIPLLASSRK